MHFSSEEKKTSPFVRNQIHFTLLHTANTYRMPAVYMSAQSILCRLDTTHRSQNTSTKHVSSGTCRKIGAQNDFHDLHDGFACTVHKSCTENHIVRAHNNNIYRSHNTSTRHMSMPCHTHLELDIASHDCNLRRGNRVDLTAVRRDTNIAATHKIR